MNYGVSSPAFRNAQELRHREANAEKTLWSHLRKNQLGVKFRRQHLLGDYIADFYCHPARLVIEVDGRYHIKKSQKEYDRSRDETMNQLGIKVLRFSNKMVLDNLENVLEEIRRHL